MSWPRRGVYMQTPLVYGFELYVCSDGGVVGSVPDMGADGIREFMNIKTCAIGATS